MHNSTEKLHNQIKKEPRDTWGSVSYTHLDVYKRQGLDYVWGISACVGDGIVDSGFVYHVFTHVVYAYVHYCLLYTSAVHLFWQEISGSSAR